MEIFTNKNLVHSDLKTIISGYKLTEVNLVLYVELSVQITYIVDTVLKCNGDIIIDNRLVEGIFQGFTEFIYKLKLRIFIA